MRRLKEQTVIDYFLSASECVRGEEGRRPCLHRTVFKWNRQQVQQVTLFFERTLALRDTALLANVTLPDASPFLSAMEKCSCSGVRSAAIIKTSLESTRL